MRILLTGTAGLVGSTLAATLGPKHQVYGICRRPLPAAAPVTPLDVDLGTEWSTAALPSSVDAVIHLAQSNRWQEFPEQAADIFAVNVASTARLLDYAVRAGATQFVLASTGGLYGSSESALTEDSLLKTHDGPLRFYFETKRAAEMLALAYSGRLRVSILRPFFIYGAGQRSPKLVPRLIDAVRRGAPVPLRGESGTILNPVAVEDVSNLVEACLRDGYHGIVNVSGGQVTSVRSMAIRIAELLGVKPSFHNEPGVAEQFVADTRLMSHLLGATPTGFDDGIAHLLDRSGVL